MPRRPVCLLVLALAVAGCGGSSEAKAPTATVGPPGTTGSTSTTAKAHTPEDEVEAAYLKSWDVYATAMRTLDPSGLRESYAGAQLDRTRADVMDRNERGAASSVRVEHDYQVQIVSPGIATVRDRYRNHSVLIDPRSGEPKEPDPNDIYVETYTLKELGGEWKVIDIVRESHSS